jgi:amino acid adenylation domain-containing protein
VPDEEMRAAITGPRHAIWLADQLHPGSAVNNVAVAVRLTGPLDVPALRDAFTRVLARHDVLRTTFPAGPAGPVARVAPPAPAELPVIGLLPTSGEPAGERALELLRGWADEPFDLARGPLLRARLIRLGEREHLLGVFLHQLVCDGPSLHLLFADLAAGYAGEPLPPLPAQFADLAVRRDPAAEEDALTWWRQALAGVPTELHLPADRPRPPVRDAVGAIHQAAVPGPETDAVTRYAARERVTGFVVTLAAYAAWLSRHTGRTDLLIGTPVNTRTAAGSSGVIGFFAATLPLRVDLSGAPTFTVLVHRVRDAVLDALTYPDVPFDRLAAELDPHRGPGRTALYQTLFTFEPAPLADPRFHGLTAAPVDVVPAAAKVDLDLNLVRRAADSDDFLLTVAYSPALFDESTVAAFADRYRRLLAAAVAAPDTPVAALPLLSPAERHAVLHEWAGRPDPVEAEGVEARFARQAAATPDAVAVRHAGTSLDYAGLDAWATEYAERLRAAGAGPGVLVAVLLPRGPTLIAALLGVLRCGAAYLSLDVTDPAPRLAALLDTAEAGLVIAEPGTAALVAGTGVPVLGTAGTAPLRGGHDPDLAYVLFTSGSTGTPKAVAVPRASLAAHARAVAAAYGLGPADRVLQFAGTAFDVAAEEVFPTLATGGCVVLRPDPPPAPAELSALLSAEAVTVVNLPSSYWQAWRATLTGRPPALRLAVVGSEPVSAADVAAWTRFPAIPLINAYGLTETTITATVHRVTGAETGTVPIGRPLPGVTVRVLDPSGLPVPPGVPGELYVGGSAPARGYLGDPARTARCFVPDPYGPPGARLVRTGDRARWRPDGTLELRGRIDAQVKIRGHRVEPAEVEAALAAHPEVEQAAVTAVPDGRGGHRLAGYVVPRVPDGLHRWLAARLPLYLVPATLTGLAALPATPGGKLDRAALPVPDPGTHRTEPPRPGTEQDIAGIWRAALGVAAVGRHDTFFDLGGSSFTAVTVRTRLADLLGRDVPMVTLFEHPTVAALAAHLTGPPGPTARPDRAARLRAGRDRLRHRRSTKESE